MNEDREILDERITRVKGDQAKLGVDLFELDGVQYVMIKDLAKRWRYPSSYQLVARMVKSGVPKPKILKTDTATNEALANLNLIRVEDADKQLFYTEASLVVSKADDLKPQNFEQQTASKERGESARPRPGPEPKPRSRPTSISQGDDAAADDIIEDEEEDEADDSPVELGVEVENHQSAAGHKHRHIHKHADDLKYRNEDKVTISQVFPQYGFVESTIDLSHASFGSLNSMSKLAFYKNLSSAGLKFLPNTKLSFPERELITSGHSFADISINEDSEQSDRQRAVRKPLGKSKKNNVHVDPNTVDLSESVIPGQGYISEFSINHLCKVPNYYVTSNHQAIPHSFNAKNLNPTSNSSFLFNEGWGGATGGRVSKNVQQLAFNNDNDNYSPSKYYYTKSYRGPGSGNYKDAALMNKINKIHTTGSKKKSHKAKLSSQGRYKADLKGLIHPSFNKDYVESLLADQRKYTEDYSNLEMLHNSLQYNVLLNSYREISRDTWRAYFKFKLFDFEQLKALQTERKEIEEKEEAIQERRRWAEEDKLRHERIRILREDEQKQLAEAQQLYVDERREIEEQKRRHQLEASLNDTFESQEDEDEFAEKLQLLESEFQEKKEKISQDFEKKRQVLMVPLPPPKVVETPQLNVLARFASPADHPEIMRHLPTSLRTTNVSGTEIPSVKKPIQYVSTYAPESNSTYLTKIEVVKLPNCNSIGWDNLRKFK
ncbi:uncharacterized protein LODBEIA_P18270 [Lodderomyces beijingensis]|uniref:Uncharacterized protein n=1 Tax=Lodderomyces beijingensis TaxID=1775926 RepID=A0ABP0ZHG5_9ASCO